MSLSESEEIYKELIGAKMLDPKIQFNIISENQVMFKKKLKDFYIGDREIK